MTGTQIVDELLYRFYAFKSRLIRCLVRRLCREIEFRRILSERIQRTPHKVKNFRKYKELYVQVWSRLIRRIYANYHDIEIGMYSYGGCFDVKNIASNVKIGRYCSFAERVMILNANHPLKYKSMHPFFYFPRLGYVKEDSTSRYNLVIGNDVWFGENAIVVPQVLTIGDGVIIAAGAVITKDVPEFAIMAGNPARVVRYRFSETTIHKIKEEKWWDKDIEELSERLDDFVHPLEESKGNCI